MNVFTIDNIKDFNLADIFDCGQCFRWQRQPNGSYTGVAMGHAVNIDFIEEAAACGAGDHIASGNDLTAACGAGNHMASGPGRLVIRNCTAAEFDNIWRPYLDLDRDYGSIKHCLTANDPIMAKAVSYGQGIRILKQDLWETIVSFLISQNNNIPRIKGCIENLAAGFGEPIGEMPDFSEAVEGEPAGMEYAAGLKDSETAGRQANQAAAEGRVCYSLPGPEQLARLSVDDLAAVRLGYRARYLIETARTVCEEGLPADEDQLNALCGVGPKVANCIMLFGMQKLDSFPIDVWVRRVMHELYGIDENNKKAMAAYAAEHFGELGGFAQQYLFYYIRETSK